VSNGYPQPDQPFPEERFGDFEDQPYEQDVGIPHRYWLHALLLLLTLVSTTVVGASLAENFAADRPFSLDAAFAGYARALHQPSFLLAGLPFSLTLLTILMAHEMGHYLTARYYGVDVSLPYFLPAPTLIGTFGAFIRIRSGIDSKRELFDIGIGGPLAGFVTLIVPLVVGIALSRAVPGIGARGDVILGTPPVMRVLEWLIFPGVAVRDISLHPMARAAWAGLLATALNLLPVGQLDGGHILYAFAGKRTRILSRVFVGALASLAVYQLVTSRYADGYTWLVWAVALALFGMRHPAIYDPYPLGRMRAWLGVAALVIFLLSFTVSPVHSNNL
jgi:membrane-associated protease RseP (regulator of RpoE activity)